MSLSIPDRLDIVTIGAGTHALALSAHLFEKRKHWQHRLRGFDPSGCWLSQWDRQFARLEIAHLRSPAVHHPDPNPFALRRFAETRPQELFPPYDLPGTQLFRDFCQATIARWQIAPVIAARVRRIEPIRVNNRSHFRLHVEGGGATIARRVVVATGAGSPQLPQWVRQLTTPYPRDRLVHSSDIDLRGLSLRGERIAIVGGGLTGGHLALGALARGASVKLILRRDLKIKRFDIDPGWLGPKYLKDFWQEPNWERRVEILESARDGGSLTPEIADRLQRARRQGAIEIEEGCEIVRADWQGDHWQIACTNGQIDRRDRLWLATGTRLSGWDDPLFADLLRTYPLEIVKGYPILDRHLRWPGCECFLMGRFAALQIGPAAPNLAGARMACDRIVPALVKPALALT